MKYLSLPIHIIKFWYLEALIFFGRSWKNCLLYLEEDLAVGLTLQYLFVESRVLTVCSKSFRLFLGFTAFLLTTIIILSIALSWFLLPVLTLVLEGQIGFIAKVLFFSGTVLFVNHLIAHPHKKLWQLKNSQEIWQCSLVKEKDVNLSKLLRTYQVQGLLDLLEQTPEKFTCLAVNFNEAEILSELKKIGKRLVVPYLGPEHFFTSHLLYLPEFELAKLNLTSEDIFDALDYLKKREEKWRIIFPWDEDFKVGKKVEPDLGVDLLEVLKDKSIEAERYKRIKISILALKEIAQNSNLPEEALKIFEKCQAQAKDGWIKRDLIKEVIDDQTKVP